MNNKKLSLLIFFFINGYFFKIFCSSNLTAVLKKSTYQANSTDLIKTATINGQIYYDSETKEYISWNKDFISIFSFENQDQDLPSAHFLDSKKRDFLNPDLFDFVKFDKTRLFVFPFDSDKKATFNTGFRYFECTKTQEGTLLIRTIPPQITCSLTFGARTKHLMAISRGTRHQSLFVKLMRHLI